MNDIESEAPEQAPVERKKPFIVRAGRGVLRWGDKNWGITSVKKITDYKRVKNYGLHFKSLGAELLFNKKPKQIAIHSFDELHKVYDVDFDSAARSHKLYRISALVSFAVGLFGIGWLMFHAWKGDTLSLIDGFPIDLVFFLNGWRYSYLCYELRSRRILPASDFFGMSHEWLPPSWPTKLDNEYTWLHQKRQ